MARSAAETVRDYCPKCEHELDANGNCPKHWPPEYERLTQFRRQTVVNRVAKKTPIAEDLLTVINKHPVGATIERLLDVLAGLVQATSAGKAKTLEQTRSRPQHAPIPSPQSAWADFIEEQVDNRLWELTEDVASFLNKPTDPRTQSNVCDVCGQRLVTNDASFCSRCGTRILDGARRCRLPGCPNEKGRRVNCPSDVPHG